MTEFSTYFKFQFFSSHYFRILYEYIQNVYGNVAPRKRPCCTLV